MKIALIGYGAMGRLFHELAGERGHQAEAVAHEADAALTAHELSERVGPADVVIDFSVAAAVRRNVEACVMADVPVIEGTTGWNSEMEEIRGVVETRNGAFVYGANFSIGVNLFYRIAGHAAELFAKFPEYETFIEEQHHSRKRDAPSGTALKIKDFVTKHVPVGDIAATRAGNIPGTHRLGFDGPADQVLLQHTARSREGFAIGALMAAEWIIGKKGFYEFTDVMDEMIGAREP